MNPRTYSDDVRWRFKSLNSGFEKVGKLTLYWEVTGDPISDDYVAEETSATELLDRWLSYVWSAHPFDADLGTPHIPIRWSVAGKDSATFEAAPPIVPLDTSPNFLKYFTYPVDDETEEPVNWLRLPVEDKLWRPGRSDKGGFIQERTGFKPSAFQPALDLRVLSAAGIQWGERS